MENSRKNLCEAWKLKCLKEKCVKNEAGVFTGLRNCLSLVALYIYMCVCIYVCVHIYLYIYLFIFIYSFMYVFIYWCVFLL